MTTLALGIGGGITFLGLVKWHCNGGVNKHKPDLSGKIIVITGANTGLGYESVKYMSRLGPQKIILACRNETRGTDAVEKIKKENKVDNLEYMQLDLNDLESVKTFVQNFNQKYDKLDILLNNAGIMALPERKTTAQGFEQQIGVNHLGHFFLTTLLMDKLKASPEARIVNLSSMAHTMGTNRLNFDDLMWETKYNDWGAYGASKLANVYFTKKLAQQLQADNIHNIKTVSLHPGVVRTELGRHMNKGAMMYLMAPVFYLLTKNPWYGTQT